MIPTIEDILAGMESGEYSREQAAAWLHQHAAAPDDFRGMVAAMALQAVLTITYRPRTDRVEDAAVDAVKVADTLCAALRGSPA